VKTTEHVFDAEGTRFYVVVTSGGRNGIVVALPDFKWSQSMSDHRAPSASWLRSQGFKNKVDAESLSTWLTANWTKLIGSAPRVDGSLLLLVGRGACGKTTLARRMEAAGARVFHEVAAADRFQVTAAVVAGEFVVAVCNDLPHANIIEGWRKVGIVHIARLDGQDLLGDGLVDAREPR
jgi:hypothetical protein